MAERTISLTALDWVSNPQLKPLFHFRWTSKYINSRKMLEFYFKFLHRTWIFLKVDPSGRPIDNILEGHS
jgi:hypothetical protein